MLRNVASFTMGMMICGFGALAIVASPRQPENHAGLLKCLEYHPSRYCRITNGYAVSPLDSSAN
jgi:hypothetical protein